MPKSCDAGANGVGPAACVASKRRSNASPVRHCGSVVARIPISGSSVLHRNLQQTLVHPVSNALLQPSWTQADGDQGPVAQIGPPDDQPASSSVTEDLSALMDLDPSANSISDFEASLFDFSWTTNAPAASSAPATEPFPPSLTTADAPASNHSPFNGNTGSGFPYPSPVQTSASQPANARGRPSATNQRDLWIRKLSYINIELYQHYVAASPSANVSLPATDSLSRLDYFSSASFSATTATAADHWNIDQTFVVTLQFLEALEDMAAASTSPHVNHHTNRLDNSTVLLVFSCYLRLLEIYAALFRDLAASPSSSSSSSPSSSSHRAPSPPPAPRSPSRSSPTSSSPNLALPRLCLGNFVIGPESPLHGSMVVHLAELLLARTHDAVGCVGGGGDGGGGRPASSSSSSGSPPNQRRIGRHRADSAGFEDGERGGEGEGGQDGDDGSTRRRASQQMQGQRAGGIVRKAVVSASAHENERRKPSLSDEGAWGRMGMTGDIPGVTVKAVREKEREVRRFLERVRGS